MPEEKDREHAPIVPACEPEIPLEELEERLEMQRFPAMDPSIACYTDLCPGDCTTHCPGGYTGCWDLCSCDGNNCLTDCASLCVADSCVLDIL